MFSRLLFALVTTLCCNISVQAANYELGKNASVLCEGKRTPASGGFQHEYICRSATWLYNRDGGDLYVCDASSVFYFLNNVFQREVGRKASCRKTASLDSPQRVDSRSEIPMSVQHQADHPIPIGSNHYWYADTQGNVGVCVFIGITLPEPTYPFTTLGSKFCIKAPIT